MGRGGRCHGELGKVWTRLAQASTGAETAEHARRAAAPCGVVLVDHRGEEVVRKGMITGVGVGGWRWMVEKKGRWELKNVRGTLCEARQGR